MPRSSKGSKYRGAKKNVPANFPWRVISMFLLCIAIIESLLVRSLILENNSLKRKIHKLRSVPSVKLTGASGKKKIYKIESKPRQNIASKDKKEKNKPFSVSRKAQRKDKKASVYIPIKNNREETKSKKEIRQKNKPKLAIVLDDWGYSRKEIDMLPDIDLPLDISIFPKHKFSSLSVWAAKKLGKEIMLHLPMQPRDVPSSKWEKDTIVVDMSNRRIRKIVVSAIESVSGVKGLNNHMGSLATTDRRVVMAVVSAARDYGLFIVDSLSSPESVMCDVADELGVGCIKRDVFLDNELSQDYIRRQLERAISVAKRKGYAVAIGHAHWQTLKVLKEMQSEIKKEVDVVFVSQLIDLLKKKWDR